METIAIVGDFHGARSTKLEQFLKDHSIKKLICLGDFDTVESILQFKGLEERLAAAGGKVLKVPGNHDHAYLNNIEITSPTMTALGKDYYQLKAELFLNPDAREYLERLVDSPFGIKVPIAQAINIYIIHGGLDGTIPEWFPEGIRALWYRLPVGLYENKENVKKNFSKMKTKGAQILIRGHDHKPIIRRETQKGYDCKKPEDIAEESGLVIDPSKTKYIINPGAYHDGYVATLDVDPNNPQMRFNFHRVTD